MRVLLRRAALTRAPLAPRSPSAAPRCRSPGFKVWDKSDLADMRKQFAASGGADAAAAGASGGGADAEL